jgi:hypothetical protein
LKCAHLIPAKAPLPEEAIFNRNKDAAEKTCATRKAQHKKRKIAKRDRNDNRIKRRKAGELGVFSDEDPSPEPSWSGDVASAAVDWSDMSGSSSSSPPRGTEVSSSRQPQVVVGDKTVGSSSHQAARPAREDQRTVRPRVAPSGTGASESQRSAPRQADPREGRRSDRRPPASLTMAPTAPTLTTCRGADRVGSRHTRHRRRARRKRRSQALPRGACSHYLSGVVEPRTFTCPSSPARATV